MTRPYTKTDIERRRGINEADWPIVEPVDNYEPNMIFLLTLPNSGSTAISEVFNNSPTVSKLQERGEGQWLIKGLCSKDRWQEKKIIDERSIRSIWVNEAYEKYKSIGSLYFIEKSPPNMMRIEVLQSIFPQHILLANNRDPYANISSMFYRYTKNIGDLATKDRAVEVSNFAQLWLRRSAVLKKVIQSQSVPYLSYEQFCENPKLLQDAIDHSRFSGNLSLDFKKNVSVKNYKPQPIKNFNSEQIEKLTNSDIKVITKTLQGSDDLVSYFGYSLRD